MGQMFEFASQIAEEWDAMQTQQELLEKLSANPRICICIGRHIRELRAIPAGSHFFVPPVQERVNGLTPTPIHTTNNPGQLCWQ